MTLRTQVLIIGGGPAGSSAAKFLARNGVDTLLIERNFSFVKPCGGGMPAFVLQEMGIPKQLVKASVDMVKVVSPGGENIDIKLSGSQIAIVERGSFDRAMRAGAESSGAKLLEAEFEGFESIGETITARLKLQQPCLSSTTSDGKPVTGAESPSGDVISVKADYVIAADGVNSRARTALKIKPSQAFLTLSEKIKGRHIDICEFWFGSFHAPRCYSWVFPCEGGLSAGTGAFKHPGIKNLWQEFKLRRGLETEGAAKGYRVPLWQGDLFNAGKILFVGDAAGQVMPMTYEGIYYSMRSGELAAEAIISRKHEDYRKLWEKSFKKEFVLMKRIWSYFMAGDRRIERIVKLHRRPEIQQISMDLWLKKELKNGGLLTFIKIFRRFLS